MLFVYHLGMPEILPCDNGQEFKGALLVFLKKDNIRLINGRPQSQHTQRLIEQANTVVKHKFQKWQVSNGRTHESLLNGVTSFQLLFLCKPKIQNTHLTSPTEKKKPFYVSF